MSADDRAGSVLPLWSPTQGVSRVLVFSAHPDDVDFGASGTVATFVDAGIEVAYCIVTDGSAGGSDPSVSRAEMVTIRQDEQRAAARVVGVSDVTFLGYPDGQLDATIPLRRDITRVIRTFRPQVVIGQSPERWWDRIYASHPDHLAAGEAVTCAVYPDSRNPFAHPELLEDEGLEPHHVGALWLMADPTADPTSTIAVDTTKAFDRKVAALRCHKSQGTDSDELEPRLREWGTALARAAGLPEGSLAEAYRVVVTT